MATGNDSKDGESPLLDESLNEQSDVDEVISPEVDKHPLQVDSEEGTFPAIDRTPTAEELC